MKTNVRVTAPKLTNHHNRAVQTINPRQELRLSVMACLLGEDQFYEKGNVTAARIHELVGALAKRSPNEVVGIGLDARARMHLRHVPLYIAVALWEHGHKDAAAALLTGVLQRADEITEVVAMWWRNGRRMLPNTMKKVLEHALTMKFGEHQLSKYHSNQSGQTVKLRDILRLVHPKPIDAEQAAMFKRIIKDELKMPDSWETAIMQAGNDKALKDTEWERLLTEGKLPDFAFLRNLRNLTNAGVSQEVLEKHIRERTFDKVLPFRFVAAARAVPNLEPVLDEQMIKAAKAMPKLKGKTVVVVDISVSMRGKLSEKSDLTRLDAAASLAAIVREASERVEVWSFNSDAHKLAPRHGMAMVDQFVCDGGTYLGRSMETINMATKYDRVIIITDGETSDRPPAPNGKGYIINVAAYGHAVSFGEYVEIAGWSENVLQYITALEEQE